MTNIERLPKVALFIDAANLIFPLEQEFAPFRLSRLISRVREEGVILMSKSYADWSREPCLAYVAQFHAQGIEMIEAYADEKRKNTADMLITTDALEHCYSEYSADVYALVSGDRDFVPLVQALHRRGKIVLCIGITTRTSSSLRRISDIFIDYYNLIPRGRSYVVPPEAEPVPAKASIADEEEVEEVEGDDRAKAFNVLRRAVAAIIRRGEETRGARVYSMIRQLKPDFDFQALGFDTFKDFVEEAVNSGSVQFSSGEPPEPGVEYSLNTASDAAQDEEAPVQRFDPSAITPEIVLGKYKDILDFKRIPWVAWDRRLPLIAHLWTRLKQAPMTISQMSEHMELMASEKGWEISSQAIYKLTYTLNIGLCFLHEGRPSFVRDIFQSQLSPAVELPEALERMHITYIKGIRLEAPGIPLVTEAVCDLLFEQRMGSYMTQAKTIITRLESGREYF